MAEERTQRRLAAIIAADVVGYSELMGQDEEGTLSRLKKLRAEFLHPKVDEYGGRIVKTTGDGTLIEFSSAVDAVSHAVDVQRGLADRNAKLPESKQIHFRIGINVGDIIIDEDDIYGDGVNIAARLEAIADPGGISISSRVYDHVSSREDIAFEDKGELNLKNISELQRVFKIQFTDGIPTSAKSQNKSYSSTEVDEEIQDVRYCTSKDGTALAYAIVGHGQPLLKAAHWMTHLEHDWHSPTFGPLFRELAEQYSLVRYDQRGNGLSDRTPSEISFDRFVEDLDAVAIAAGLEQFPIYGLSQGAAVGIRYAVEHPERVSALILQGGYSRGRLKRGKLSDEDFAKVQALTTLIRTGWGQDNPAFRQMFTTMFIPGASSHFMDSFNELMHVATAPDVAAEIFEVNIGIDISNILDQVQAPTLIIHGRGDNVAPFEEGRRLAISIPNARLVELNTDNHLPLHDEPEWPRLVSEIKRFLAECT